MIMNMKEEEKNRFVIKMLIPHIEKRGSYCITINQCLQKQSQADDAHCSEVLTGLFKKILPIQYSYLNKILTDK